MVASLPSQTITGTSAADIRASTPGTNALVETYQSADTITLNNGDDFAVGGKGADSIVVGGSASVALNNSVIAGYGSDTIRLTSASTVAAGSFSLEANQGNDSIYLGTAGQSIVLSQAFVGGGLGNDTISINSGVSQAVSTSIKGGDNADSITLSTGFGVLSNSQVAGNKGADTIVLASTSANGSSVQGGMGHDSITIDTGGVAGLVNAGAGNDTIALLTGAQAPTIVGGGLADTISITSSLAVSTVIFGDASGVTSAGTGTGGTADGGDQIGNSGLLLATGASIYGAGGADTIELGSANAATAAIILNGGDLADTINLSGSNANTAGITFAGGNGADTLSLNSSLGAVVMQGGLGQDSILANAGSALNVAGGKGVDSILLTNAATGTTTINGGDQGDYIYFSSTFSAGAALQSFNGNGTIDGANGADTIAANGFGSAGSITGGAGNDSIVMGVAVPLVWTANGTISGGAGVDTVVLQASAGAGTTANSNIASGIASVAYEAGDIIHLAFTAGGAQAIGGTVNVGQSAASTVTALTAGAGGLYVYSDGTDTYFGFNTNIANAGNAIQWRVTGADLVTTTAVDQNVAVNSSNVAFTVAGTASTGLSITLT